MAEEKPTSLLQLGYTLEFQKDQKDSKGNEIVAVCYRPFFLKKTKRGNIKAYREVDGVVETTVDGLYNFQTDGKDFVGKRLPSTTKTETTAA